VRVVHFDRSQQPVHPAPLVAACARGESRPSTRSDPSRTGPTRAGVNPRDDRIVHMGPHQHVDPALGHAVEMGSGGGSHRSGPLTLWPLDAGRDQDAVKLLHSLRRRRGGADRVRRRSTASHRTVSVATE
jgi:hypothetical protein